jgi:hypothetical protein
MENEDGGVENSGSRGDVPCGAVLGAIVGLVGTPEKQSLKFIR